MLPAQDEVVLPRRPQGDPVVYRDEVRDILDAIAEIRENVRRIRFLLEEDDGEEGTPEAHS